MPNLVFPDDVLTVNLAADDYILFADHSDDDNVKRLTGAGLITFADGYYLNKTNTDAFTPSADYHPATKKYVDDAVSGENLWDRTGTTLEPHNANDNVDIGSGVYTGNKFVSEALSGYSVLEWDSGDGKIQVSYGTDHNVSIYNKGAVVISVGENLAGGQVAAGVLYNTGLPLYLSSGVSQKGYVYGGPGGGTDLVLSSNSLEFNPGGSLTKGKVYFGTALTSYFDEVNDDWTLVGDVNINPNSDNGNIVVGTARMGFPTGGSSDYAYWGHYDCWGDGASFALAQGALGDTYLNASTGQKIILGVAGAGTVYLTSTRMGVGTATPEVTGHVYYSAGGSAALPDSGDVFAVERTDKCYINVIAGENNPTGIIFSDETRAAGYVGWNIITTSTLTVGSIGKIDLKGVGEVTVNEAGADVDFRVEGDTVTDLLKIDAGTDTVSIGGGATSSTKGSLYFSDGTYNRMHLLPYSADSLYMMFDMYFDGTNFKSQDAGSNFDIRKAGDTFSINSAFGVTVGENATVASRLRFTATEAVVNEGGNDFDFRVESDTNANMFFVDGGNNRVGIGTNTPDTIFNIETGGAAVYAEQTIDSYNANGAGYCSFITFRKSHNDTVGTKTETINNEYLGAIDFMGVDNTSVFDWGARIKAVQDGAAGVKIPTNVYLETYSDTAVNTNQLVLHNDGRVGIGTDEPTYQTHIQKDAAAVDMLCLSNQNGANGDTTKQAFTMKDSTSASYDAAKMVITNTSATSKHSTVQFFGARNGVGIEFLTFKGSSYEIVINDGGGQFNFRVESDTISNALGVDSVNNNAYSCSLFPSDDDTYYLGKNDDDTPLAWKGVILKDTTNGRYYRVEVINGVVTATDLTD